VWLTLRQAVPLAVSGLIVALLLAAVEVNVFGRRIDEAALAVALDLGGTTWFIGMAWSVIVAAGVFGGELQPKLARFWSSRPIAPANWLAVKYLAGLAAVLLVIDGTPIMVGSLAQLLAPAFNIAGSKEMSWSYAAVMPLQHAVLYSLGVAAVIATRSWVFGAAAALAVHTVMIVALDFLPRWIHRDEIDVYNDLIDAERAGTLNLWQHGYPLVVVWSTALIALFYVISRRMLQRQLSD
jgi:hypothetical protein